jgi:hypothetical protein
MKFVITASIKKHVSIAFYCLLQGNDKGLNYSFKAHVAANTQKKYIVFYFKGSGFGAFAHRHYKVIGPNLILKTMLPSLSETFIFI